jgi:small subunit ribosomal protein S16
MPVRIRLTRHGRKAQAYYHLVAADSRAPRDGKFIEKLGIYNPNTNPATIELNFERALYWLQEGAQPSDTAKGILSYKGVMMKKHLLDGVKKGAFDEAAADAKFEKWMGEKTAKIQAKKDKLNVESRTERKERLEAERKVNEAKAQAVAKKQADAAKAAAHMATEETSEAEPAAETPEQAAE